MATKAELEHEVTYLRDLFRTPDTGDISSAEMRDIRALLQNITANGMPGNETSWRNSIDQRMSSLENMVSEKLMRDKQRRAEAKSDTGGRFWGTWWKFWT
jgi:hypothetical protein